MYVYKCIYDLISNAEHIDVSFIVLCMSKQWFSIVGTKVYVFWQIHNYYANPKNSIVSMDFTSIAGLYFYFRCMQPRCPIKRGSANASQMLKLPAGFVSN